LEPIDELIKKSSIFSGFDPDELKAVARLFHKKKFKKGVVVFHEGQLGTAFYLISSGRVKISKLAEDGRELIFGIFGDGAIFGDVPVFDGGLYPATAATLVDTEVNYMSRDDFERLVIEYPQVALKIVRVLGKRLRQAHSFVMDIAMKSVPQRLSTLLLRLAKQYGRSEDGYTVIDLPLSRQEIADLIGVSRETATRELSKFGRSGIIRLDGKKIYLIDRPKLELWAGV
jgi:CRP/FNR family cyclic AMP-dependent transcriptional regulator